jgi:hypothetical protein
MKSKHILLLLFLSCILSSCESDQERNARLIREEQQRIEHAAQLERIQQEKELYDKYINNSLPNGSTPWAYCFGNNKNCSNYGCSEIRVKTPNNSDIMVTIKKNGVVVRHAYIKAGDSYTFELPNGTYQPFFYYGKGWNPEKFMKNTSCGELIGGFISDELFGKDDHQTLNNSILEYELFLQKDGNFSTRPSNQEDAL